MTSFVDFDAIAAELDHECPFSFKLGGRTWHTRKKEDIPLSTVFDLSTAGQDTPEGGGRQRMQIGAFFHAVLVPDEHEAFDAMLADPRSALTAGLMEQLVNHVSQNVFGRSPTEPPS